MSHHEQAIKNSIPHKRSLPASYSEGAVGIPLPQNPSTPVAKSKSPRCALYQRLYTGPPVDPVEEDHAAPVTSSKCQLVRRKSLLALSSSYWRWLNFTFPALAFSIACLGHGHIRCNALPSKLTVGRQTFQRHAIVELQDKGPNHQPRTIVNLKTDPSYINTTLDTPPRPSPP
jgi:hypothetical protein